MTSCDGMTVQEKLSHAKEMCRGFWPIHPTLRNPDLDMDPLRVEVQTRRCKLHEILERKRG